MNRSSKICTIRHGEKWANVKENSDQPISLHDLEIEAIQAGMEYAQKNGMEHTIDEERRK